MGALKFFYIAIFFLSISIEAQAADFRIIQSLKSIGRRRPALDDVQMIILHTTEGGDRGVISWLQDPDNNDAHYVILSTGEIHQLIPDGKVAHHAGDSMWMIKKTTLTGLNSHSLGIETVGYHDRRPSDRQIAALKWLVTKLKQRYKVPDELILPHSMVAYGKPRPGLRRNWRGRKAGCGMGFALRELRRKIGLGDAPRIDPNLATKQVMIGNVSLFNFLFRRTPDLAEPFLNIPAPNMENVDARPGRRVETVEATPIAPPRNGDVAARPAPRLENVSVRPAPILEDVDVRPLPKPLESIDLENSIRDVTTRDSDPKELAGESYALSTTLYMFPGGGIYTGAELLKRMRGLLESPPIGTKILIGYKYGGLLTARSKLSKQVGRKWNAPTTLYRFARTSWNQRALKRNCLRLRKR